jgi:short-subunit dehydrogenase
MAGLTSPPGMSPYNVTKHAVVTLSESLAQELAMTHPEVGVSVLCPGWVRTRIHEADRNRPTNPADAIDEAAGAPEELAAMREMVAGFINGGLDPAAVAAQVVEAVKENRTYILTHPHWHSMITERTERIVSGESPALAMLPTE